MTDIVPGSEHDFENNRKMHSFVVRVWLEISGTELDQKIWRGHIIHLPDYKRHYFSNLNDIATFIASEVKDHN